MAARRVIRKPRKGATPVPGPIMMMGADKSEGCLKSEALWGSQVCAYIFKRLYFSPPPGRLYKSKSRKQARQHLAAAGVLKRL